MRDRESRLRGGHRHEPRAADLPIPREVDSDSDSDGEFEFPSVSTESAAAGGGAAAADELFAGGRIRAFYPVFGRVLDADAGPAPRARLGRLFELEQARTSSVASTSSTSSSASSSSSAELDAAPPESYCLWTPGSSPASSPSRPPRKSGSTGSILRWRRIGDLVAGRSRSDGRDKFLFLSAPPSPARDKQDHHSSPAAGAKTKPPPPKGSKATSELDTVAAGRRMSYGGGGKASPGGRRTFLPYRQDLVGLFANVH